MQRRPSKRQQHASQSPGTAIQSVDAQQDRNKETKETKGNFDFTAHVPTTICLVLVCLLPFLAAVVLFVWFYYSFNYLGDDGNGSRLLHLLHDYESISSFSPSSSTLDIDDRIYGNGQLRPEDHIYREALTQKLNWNITAKQRRPDGVNKNVYLINDLFPGPIIEARSGDTLQILVHNGLENEQVSLHWHGLNMRDANTMDGAIGVTQCGIQPGQSFWYNFTIPGSQSGTFWYHAHSTVQRTDGLFGGLIVHQPVALPPSPSVRGLLAKHQDMEQRDENGSPVPDSVKYGYEKEIVLLIGDWYHRTAEDVANWYLWWGSRGYEPVPDSLLINGVGRFNCSRAVPARPVDCVGLTDDKPSLLLDADSSYRVRLVNTGSLTGISLGFEPKTSLQVITLDGGIPVGMGLEEDKSSIGVLFPGQRVDFILRPSKAHASWMTVKLDESDFKIGNPALETIQSFPLLQSPIASKTLLSTRPPITTETQDNNRDISSFESDNIINIEKIPSASTILSDLPPRAEQTHLVYAKVERLSRLQNIPHGFFNRTTWKMQSDPALPLLGLPRSQWDKNQLAISTGDRAVWVDFIVNNLDEGAHPFHFHGHNFYVIAMGESADGSTWGSYNPWTNKGPTPDGEEIYPYDLTKAVLRDTVQIPRRGYAVLRFRADNPGVWLFHCHVMWHLAGGMAMLFDTMSGSDGVAHQPWLGAEGMQCSA